MSQTLRKFARELPFLRHFIARYVIPSGYYDKAFINLPLSNSWKQRIALAIESPDNQFIQRVQNAGVIIKGKQIMHNGLMINLGSYYGSEIAKLLLENRGVHEPQEERVFQEIIPTIAPGSKMLELGSFWAFYSLWFKSKIPHSTCYMIEPDKFNIESGKANFKLNGYQGNFFNYFISDKSSLKNHKQTPTICVDDFRAEQ